MVLKRTNWTYAAPRATQRPKRIRPALESGVVLGSEIMKKLNKSNAPLSILCSGIVMGSPSQAERPTSSKA